MSLKKALLGVSALAVTAAMSAPVAQAAPASTITGGGGTLAAKLYRDVFNCYSATSTATPTGKTITESTTYGIYAASLNNPAAASYPAGLNAACTSPQGNLVALAYAPVGSGAGLSAFTTGVPSAFGPPASSNPVAYLNGNSSVGVGALPYPLVAFAGSDAYLSSTQITAAAAIDGGAAIFQIPTLATTINLPVGQVSGVSLSLANVCDIFSGQAKVPGNTATSQQVYVRADGSGTSAIFGLWLIQNCPATTKGAQGIAYNFLATNGFGTTSPTWSTAFVGSLATLSAVSGSGGIASAVAGAKYSIGYVSPDYVYPIVGSSLAYSAKVNSVAPTYVTAGTHLNAVAIPSSYNNNIGFTLNNESTAASLSETGYPIVGFTFVDTYGCYSSTYAGGKIGSSAQGTTLKTFLNALYSSSTFGKEATAIINASGFAAPPTSLIAIEDAAGGPFSASGINGTQCPKGRT
jgi:ABC-type phosphate transport system substrate-binding protein